MSKRLQFKKTMVKTKEQPKNYDNEIIVIKEDGKQHHNFKISKEEKKKEKEEKKEKKKEKKEKKRKEKREKREKKKKEKEDKNKEEENDGKQKSKKRRESPNIKEPEVTEKKRKNEIIHKDIKTIRLINNVKLNIDDSGYLGNESDYEFTEMANNLEVKSKKNTNMVSCFGNGSSNVVFGDSSFNCVGSVQNFSGSFMNGSRSGRMFVNGVEITEKDLQELREKKSGKVSSDSEKNSEKVKHYLAKDSIQKIEKFEIRSSSKATVSSQFLTNEHFVVNGSGSSRFEAPYKNSYKSVTLSLEGSSCSSILNSDIESLSAIAYGNSSIDLEGSRSDRSKISVFGSSKVDGLYINESAKLTASGCSGIYATSKKGAKIEKNESGMSNIRIE